MALFIPLKGVSLIARAGQVFYDPAADAALVGALRANLDQTTVEVRAWDTDINDPAFARAMAERLHALYQTWVQPRAEV